MDAKRGTKTPINDVAYIPCTRAIECVRATVRALRDVTNVVDTGAQSNTLPHTPHNT